MPTKTPKKPAVHSTELLSSCVANMLKSYATLHGIPLSNHAEIATFLTEVNQSIFSFQMDKVKENNGGKMPHNADNLLNAFPALAKFADEIKALQPKSYLEISCNFDKDTSFMLWRHMDDNRYEIAVLKMNCRPTHLVIYDAVVPQQIDSDFTKIISCCGDIVGRA